MRERYEITLNNFINKDEEGPLSGLLIQVFNFFIFGYGQLTLLYSKCNIVSMQQTLFDSKSNI